MPLPGETALIIAGTYAGTTHHLNPWLIFAVASAAAIIGDNIGYWLGDKGGYRLARRYGPRIRLDERKLKTARYLFDRHGTPVVFELPRVFRTGNLRLIHAASCPFRYSSRTSCGVR